MADIDDTSLGLAIDHVKAIRDIHEILDGIEWDAGTIELVAKVIEDVGYSISEPKGDSEIWSFPARIYVKLVEDEVTLVSAVVTGGDGYLGSNAPDFRQDQGDGDRPIEEVNDALAKYLEGTKRTREDGYEVYPICWEG